MMEVDDTHEHLYREMLDWPLADLQEELDARIDKLERVVEDLKKAEHQQSPSLALVGIVVFGLLSLGSLILALLPFTHLYPRFPSSLGYLSEIIAVLVTPVFLYGLYVIYVSFQSATQKRHSVERFMASASHLLSEAKHLSSSSLAESYGSQQDATP